MKMVHGRIHFIVMQPTQSQRPELGLLIFCCLQLEIHHNFWTRGSAFSFYTRPWILCSWFWAQLGFPCSSDSKESAYNAKNLGSIPGDLLEEEMATQSNILAWRIPWTEETGRLQSMVSQRVGHDWVTNSLHFWAQYLTSTQLEL